MKIVKLKCDFFLFSIPVAPQDVINGDKWFMKRFLCFFTLVSKID